MERKPRNRKACEKWEAAFPPFFYAPGVQWSKIFALPFKLVRETKYQTLQFQILHRTDPCKRYLYVRNIIDSEDCPQCGIPDDIVHYFVNCATVKTLWSNIFRWYEGISGRNFANLSSAEIIFGVIHDHNSSLEVLNVLLLIKFFIFKRKLYHDANLSFIAWLCDLKTRLESEKLN